MGAGGRRFDRIRPPSSSCYNKCANLCVNLGCATCAFPYLSRSNLRVKPPQTAHFNSIGTAFGFGIDKPDVRLVVHWAIPQANPWSDGYDGRPSVGEYYREMHRRMGDR